MWVKNVVRNFATYKNIEKCSFQFIKQIKMVSSFSTDLPQYEHEECVHSIFWTSTMTCEVREQGVFNVPWEEVNLSFSND